MRFRSNFAVFSALVALGATPALAAGGSVQSTSNRPATAGVNAKKYGKYCQGTPKKHVVHGMKGTPFTVCVHAMFKLDQGTVKSARVACKVEPKKHVSGVRGTLFSQCVNGGKQLLAHKKSSTTSGA